MLDADHRTRRDDLSRFALVCILIVFAAMSLLSNFLFPPFEGPDEHSHYQYCKLLAQGKGLPIQTDPERTADAEGFNPPLYYIIPAWILNSLDPNAGRDITQIAVLDRDELIDLAVRQSTNPKMNPLAFQDGERRVFLHPQEGVFASKPIIAIHAMRVFSTICSILALIGVSWVAKVAMPGRSELQLFAVGVVAFNPQFVYISSQINRDNLVCVFTTLVIWRLLVILSRRQVNYKDAILLGLFLGFGALSKPTIFYLFVPTTIVLFLTCLNSADEKETATLPVKSTRSFFARFVGLMLCIVGLSFAIAGWFYIRNAKLYGNWDFLGWKKQVELHPIFSLMPEQRMQYFREMFFQLLFTSFWGRFGWLYVALPYWLFCCYGALTALTLLAVPIHTKTNESKITRESLMLCWGIFLLNILALIWFNFRFKSNQGRQLFPSIAALAVLIACGLDRATWYCSATKKQQLLRVATALLALAQIFVQAFVVYPLYFGDDR